MLDSLPSCLKSSAFKAEAAPFTSISSLVVLIIAFPLASSTPLIEEQQQPSKIIKMFTPKLNRYENFSKHRAGKSSNKRQRSFKSQASFQRFEQAAAEIQQQQNSSPQVSPSLTSAIVTLCVGRERRLFAAHEDVLRHSPYFGELCNSQFFQSTKRIELQEDEPEIFSSVLEYLYKGDYYPRLEFDKRRRSWALENMDVATRAGTVESTVFVNGLEVVVLKDTVIYVCLIFPRPLQTNHV